MTRSSKQLKSILEVPLLCFTLATPRKSIKLFLYSIVAILLLSTQFAKAQKSGERLFVLNEKMHESLTQGNGKTACNPSEVLADLLRQIGEKARVYPTENYYYFTFYRGGKTFLGSLRLAVGQRDKGIVQFACYEKYTGWIDRETIPLVTKNLSQKNGVVVTKLSDFTYKVSFEKYSTTFHLNNLSQTKNKVPPAGNDKFVGRAFDESGLIFNLMYNKPSKKIYFILDKPGSTPETFIQHKTKIFIGKRTGFVFFEDQFQNYILVAANAEEVYKNTWYDGPFDQLPENFYKKIKFWDVVYDAFPELKGKIRDDGVMINEPDSVFGIFSYREYQNKRDLQFITKCTETQANRKDLLSCFFEGT